MIAGDWNRAPDRACHHVLLQEQGPNRIVLRGASVQAYRRAPVPRPVRCGAERKGCRTEQFTRQDPDLMPDLMRAARKVALARQHKPHDAVQDAKEVTRVFSQVLFSREQVTAVPPAQEATDLVTVARAICMCAPLLRRDLLCRGIACTVSLWTCSRGG